jgi:lipopolysaccharide biosynthesis protein
MKRLAIYAHFDASAQVASHVLYYLEQLRELGFQICFVSNSEITPDDKKRLGRFCEKIIVRENRGLDFAMWKQALADADLSQLDELLLTNSSIVGPLQPLAPLWQNPTLAGCDFWGLTDNDELNLHLQSYFLVFRQPVLQNPHFAEFWRSVLPFRDKLQVIRSYEAGLTCWLEEAGFKWKAIYPQREIWPLFLQQRGRLRKTIDVCLRRNLKKPLNTTLFAPDILLQRGMPFFKAALLKGFHSPSNGRKAFAWLESAQLPDAIRKTLETRQR